MTNDIECLACRCIGALSTSIMFLTFWEGGISVLGSAFVISDVWVEQAFSKCNSKHERDMNQKIDFLISGISSPSNPSCLLHHNQSHILCIFRALLPAFYQLVLLLLFESTP